MKGSNPATDGERRTGRSKSARGAEIETADNAAGRWLFRVIAASVLLIPLVMSISGEDVFRYPKDLALRLETILLVIILAVAWALGLVDRSVDLRRNLRRKWFALVVMICSWTILCAIFSTNRRVSLPPTLRVLEYGLVFTVTVLVLRGRPAWIAGLIVPPAIVNALVYVLQEFEIWSPFDTSLALEKHIGRTALIGNPNDVGGYLIVPALLASSLAIAHPRRRVWWAGAASILVAATFITQTVAAIGALIVALIVLIGLWLRSWSKMIGASLVIALIAGSISLTYQPLRLRVIEMREAFSRHDYEELSASRMLPFFAAAEMIRDRPFTGVGPGCFAYNFFEYKLDVQNRHRWLFGPNLTGHNFGEVHNDHLQVASETGLPGYGLFIASLVLIAWGSLRSQDGSAGNDEEKERADLIRLLSLPLAVSLFVLALAQFPLELVAPAHTYLWAAATTVSWRRQ